MNTPIINPLYLTEEQRKTVRAEYDLNAEHIITTDSDVDIDWYSGRNITLEWLFGKDFFEKGE